jgi:fucose permease
LAAVARWAFPVVGFFLSVLWSIVFSLALDSVERHHGALAGIVCSGILGGAAVPWLIGALGDRVGLARALTLCHATLLYLLGISRWARQPVGTGPR